MSASKKRVREEGWKLGCGRKKVGMGFCDVEEGVLPLAEL